MFVCISDIVPLISSGEFQAHMRVWVIDCIPKNNIESYIDCIQQTAGLRFNLILTLLNNI